MPSDDLLEHPHSARGQRLRDQVKLVTHGDAALIAPPLQVLVVEDESTLREMVTLALLDEGYEVVSATNGADALQRVEQYQPDVILLDLHMPVMDGPSFAQRYQALPGPHAPIVIFSAGGSAQTWAQRLKAAAFIDKPLDLWALGALLRSCALRGAGEAGAAG